VPRCCAVTGAAPTSTATPAKIARADIVTLLGSSSWRLACPPVAASGGTRYRSCSLFLQPTCRGRTVVRPRRPAGLRQGDDVVGAQCDGAVSRQGPPQQGCVVDE